MASKNIKGLTVEIGGDTTKLGKALEDVNKKSRDLSSELGQINKLLKLDPGNTDLLAQKQKVLADAMENTREKLDKLKEAERQVQAQFERGEVSEAQVRELQREIIATTKKMDGYERAAQETADEIDRLGDEADGAGKDIQNMGDNAKEAERESSDLGNTLDGSLKAGFTAVIGVATAAAAAVVGCVEASQEYRQEMGKLDTAFTSNNLSSEAAQATYKELQSILGETDQAVEAANHLAALADTEEDLGEWTGILTGVYAKFGVSLPVENLAETANETARTGKLTGGLVDAINWASEAGETFGVTMKEATKENEDWNKAVKEATTAEEFFQLALDECSNEQERQQLITKTLTKLYKGAGEQYKKTNKTVIEANKATEKWNATVAEIGDEMAPVMTDIKAFGASLLEDAKEPLRDTARFISSDLLPALTSVSKWVLNNGPVIKGTLAGVATAMVAYKAVTIAVDISQKGLAASIMSTTAAQTALNLVQSATPWGLIAVAIAGVATALTVYAVSTEEAAEKAKVLTAEERELMAQAKETNQKLREQRSATDEAAGGISSQMGHVQDLANELQTLADKSGGVQEKDRARVQFILNELNGALGTEYKMVDGVVQKYDELTDSIDEVIRSKTANALLEARNADYVAALENEGLAWDNLVLAQKDYDAAIASQNDYYENTYLPKRQGLLDQLDDAEETHNIRREERIRGQLAALELAWTDEKNKVYEKEQVYNDAALAYGENTDEIMSYEEAQTAALQGNYERATEILKGKSQVFGDYADNVDEETKQAIDALYKEAVNAGIEAARTKKNFEDGVEGYTKEMVEESEQAYDDALGAWADARIEAEGVGEDIGDGFGEGMESQRGGLIGKARSIVSSIIGAFRDEADSHSPSRKMVAFGEDMGEGAVIGVENKTEDAQRAARHQVSAMLDAYNDAEASGQSVLRSVGVSRMGALPTGVQGSTGGDVLGKMDAILAAIKSGQFLTIDGDTLIGYTDSGLGQRRALAARGAS